MKAHTYYIICGRPPIAGEAFPLPPPGGATGLDAEFAVEETVKLRGLVAQYNQLGLEPDVLLLEGGSPHRRLSLLQSASVARPLRSLVVLASSFDVRRRGVVRVGRVKSQRLGPTSLVWRRLAMM